MPGAGGYEECVVRNHDEKTKNMQRSVLPSARRKTARDERRQIHKRARARERDMLNTFDAAADLDDFDPDFRENRRISATDRMVWDRRSADKIGPLTRWAVRTVVADPELRDATLHDQVAYFEALLPTDLIGKHAVDHIRWALEWELHGRVVSLWESRLREERRRPTRAELRDRVAVDARRIFEEGRHKELNVALRRAFEAGPPLQRFPGTQTAPEMPRLLLGHHDVDDFAAETARFWWLCDVVATVAQREG